ncbi:hypothetical protein K440DRAFT_636319 [Wilcoxina mikolae CBS 423.85]|nr:hypothetical protein K440DRAFT_636319 [Wilcoxina mikolae CBS 423.85]
MADGSGHLSEQAINWICTMDDVQLEIIDVGLLESLEQAEKFAKICDLNDSLAANIKNLKATEPVQEITSKELAVAHQDIDDLKEKLRIEKCRSAKLERWLEQCKSELEPAEQITIKHLQLGKQIVLHQVKNLSLDKSELESELRVL